MNRLSIWLSALVIVAAALQAEEIEIRTPSGQYQTIEVSLDASFSSVVEQVDSYIQYLEPSQEKGALEGKNRPFLIDFMLAASHLEMGFSGARSYFSEVTQNEKTDIRYIVTTLASASWAKLLGHKSSIEKAGDRVDHVHPLRFIMCIFSDEELKGCFHSIRERKHIWKQFIDGLFESLESEAKRDNMKDEYIQHFADSLKIEASFVSSLVHEKRWGAFIDTLMKLLPRQGNPGRYDM